MRRSLLFGVAGFLAGGALTSSGVVWRGDGAKAITVGDTASLSFEAATPGQKSAVAGLRNAVVVFPSDEAPRLRLDADSPHSGGCHWGGADGNGSFSRPLLDVWCVATSISCRNTMAVADAECSKDMSAQQGLQAAPAQRAPPTFTFPAHGTTRATCGIAGFVVQVALTMLTCAFAATAAVIVLLAHRVARLADAVATSGARIFTGS
jgi:hypothetical protein